MADPTSPKRGGARHPNIKRRGSTYTFYVYVTGPDGRREQHSKGGFKTLREAEAARIATAHALATGTYVKAERVTLADFLTDEWLPSRRPPVLEASTWHSYERNLRLHVIPRIGSIPLQKLSPVDLNRLYRQLLESGRRTPGPPRRRSSVIARATELRANGMTFAAIAERTARRVPARDSPHQELSVRDGPAWRHRCSGCRGHSGDGPANGAVHPHDPPRRTEGRAALEPGGAQRRRCSQPTIDWRLTARLDQRHGTPTSSAPSSTTPVTASTCRRGSSSPRADVGAASVSGCAGAIWTSMERPRSSPAR